MLKNTKTRQMIKEVLSSSKTPLTPAQIFDILKSKNITLSSIYRSLEAFTKENIVIKASNQKGTALYALNQDDHHHYLECKKCHHKIQLDFCPYHSINHKIFKQYNFEVDENNVVLYGLCKNCRTSNK